MGLIADQCRYAKYVAEKGGLEFAVLDSGDGYLFQISSGNRSFIAGAGPLSSYPINSAFAASAARDKVFTNRLLDLASVPNLGGRAFFLSRDSESLRSAGSELEDAESYLLELGGRVFCKPLTGSRGDFAELVSGLEAFRDYVARCTQKHSAIVIQNYLCGEEYRVFVLDGHPLFCVQKRAVEIVGDGKRSVLELIVGYNQTIVGTGLSPYPAGATVLGKGGGVVNATSVPQESERLNLVGRKNLSFSGTPILHEPIPVELAEIATRSAIALGLRVAAVDIIETGGGLRRVVEVNSNPEISSLERLNRWDLIERIWSEIIEQCLQC